MAGERESERSLRDRIVADGLAVGRWYATTHGKGFEHDHHCPVPTYPASVVKQYKSRPACTCGWDEAQGALQRLSEDYAS